MIQLSIREMAQLLRDKQLSIPELCSIYFDRARAFNQQTNALLKINCDIDPAELLQAEEALLDESKLLAGIPLVHKDLFCTQGMVTTCGSRMLENFVPPYDATVVSNLKDQGMITVAKANMDEFAMGSSNEHSAFGSVQNPWDLTRVPGGSSGGSAAAVAARMVPVATATDTGGSIRQPTALCGVTGIKPSYGRVSRYGMVAFASSLDQGGVMARTADDCGIVLSAMCGHDHKDSTSHPDAAWQWNLPTLKNLKGIKVGVVIDWIDGLNDEGVKQSTIKAIDTLRQQGAEIIDVALPHAHLAVSAYYVIAPAECSSNLSRFDGVRYGHRSIDTADLETLYVNSRSEGFGEEVKRRIMVGTWALSSGYYDAYYLKAQKIRRLIAEDFNKVFEQVDVLAAPVSPEVAFKQEEKADGVSMYQADVFTIPASLAGLPCLSMPIQSVHGLPVGLQLIGRYFDERSILNVAHQFQQVTEWHKAMPEAYK